MAYGFQDGWLGHSGSQMECVGDVIYEGANLPRMRILISRRNDLLFYALDRDHYIELARNKDELRRVHVERMVARLYAENDPGISIHDAVVGDARKISGLHQRIRSILESSPEASVN